MSASGLGATEGSSLSMASVHGPAGFAEGCHVSAGRRGDSCQPACVSSSGCQSTLRPPDAPGCLQAALVCLMLSLVLSFRDPPSLRSHVRSTPIPNFSQLPEAWLDLTSSSPGHDFQGPCRPHAPLPPVAPHPTSSPATGFRVHGAV